MSQSYLSGQGSCRLLTLDAPVAFCYLVSLFALRLFHLARIRVAETRNPRAAAAVFGGSILSTEHIGSLGDAVLSYAVLGLDDFCGWCVAGGHPRGVFVDWCIGLARYVRTLARHEQLHPSHPAIGCRWGLDRSCARKLAATWISVQQVTILIWERGAAARDKIALFGFLFSHLPVFSVCPIFSLPNFSFAFIRPLCFSCYSHLFFPFSTSASCIMDLEPMSILWDRLLG